MQPHGEHAEVILTMPTFTHNVFSSSTDAFIGKQFQPQDGSLPAEDESIPVPLCLILLRMETQIQLTGFVECYIVHNDQHVRLQKQQVSDIVLKP
jgi:hypothetical protein